MTRFLLDTNVLLYAASDPTRLGQSVELLRTGQTFVSAASTWELAIKQSIGKLDLRMPVARWITHAIRELALDPVDITTVHAARVETLPMIHRDPFDRLLVAQAEDLGAELLTTDRTLAAYGSVVRLV